MKHRHRWSRAHNRVRLKQAIHRHGWLLNRYFATTLGRESAFHTLAISKAFNSAIPFDVNEAVEQQLSVKVAPPHDPTKQMQADYGYDQDSMDGFLAAVRKHLSNEGHSFTYDTPFVQSALTSKLIDLKTNITKKTT